jgi:hypothetical protein
MPVEEILPSVLTGAAAAVVAARAWVMNWRSRTRQ